MTLPTAMEPLLPEDRQGTLADLATDLVAKAGAIKGKLNPALRESVGALVRSMNCYYSNLIEGHETHPFDIDRALAGDYSAEPEKRNLQLEAKAHIDVQRSIDAGDAGARATTVEFIRWVHREFCSRLPAELLIARDRKTGREINVVPGELRGVDVQVGRHLAPEPAALPALLNRFSDFYGDENQPKIRRIIGIAASHHRLLWIHPFADGNGRVARLFSHAFLRELGIGSSLWSISRGLARTVDEYKAALQEADEPRRGDLDGRGNLTQAGLESFCAYFSIRSNSWTISLNRQNYCAAWKSGAKRRLARQGSLKALGRCFAKLCWRLLSHAAKHPKSPGIRSVRRARFSTN